jgi:hypothetical protein
MAAAVWRPFFLAVPRDNTDRRKANEMPGNRKRRTQMREVRNVDGAGRQRPPLQGRRLNQHPRLTRAGLNDKPRPYDGNCERNCKRAERREGLKLPPLLNYAEDYCYVVADAAADYEDVPDGVGIGDFF